MKKLTLGIISSLCFVLVCTYIVYQNLESVSTFWNAQVAWSVALIICWIVVASGYYHQGWLVRNKKGAPSVSIVLPVAVFCVQCILFVKGIFYSDWSLILGALLVNSGVLFSLYHIVRARRRLI